MKKTGKLLILSLASVMLLSACNQNKKDPDPKPDPQPEVIAVTGVALNKTTLNLRVGQFDTLVATITPNNASNQGVTWESSVPGVASVDNEGKVTALEAGKTVITVKTKDGNKTATCNVDVKEAVIEADLTSLRLPSFYTNGYASKIQNLDTITNLPNRVDIDYNTYFQNKEGGADLYKVGSQNAFVFHVTGVAVDEETLEQNQIANPFVKVDLYVKRQTEYELVSEPSQYVEMSGQSTIDTFKFKSEANGKKFKLVFSGDDSRYEEVTAQPVTLEFEVIEAYNITSPEELILMDNRDNADIYDDSTKDPWGDVRQSLRDANKYPSSSNDVKGVVLHRSFEISSDFLPQSMRYTESEITSYINANGADFQAWYQTKNNTNGKDYTAETAKALLVNSTKDWVTLFYRLTHPSDNFVFEGNYNSIDFSKINQIYSFQGALLEEGKLQNYQDTTSSHGQIFGFNYHTNGEDGIRGGTVNFNNVTFRGNGKYASDDNYMGGLMVFKVDSAEAKFNNLITYDTFMSYMASGERFDINANRPETKLIIDRCKSYGSYNSMCYSWGGHHNTVTNSYLEKAGGALFLMDDVDYDDKNGGFHSYATFDTENCRLHNLATGLEPWFKQFNATSLIDVIKLLGSDMGYIGITAKQLSSVEKKYKTTVDFMVDGQDIVPVVNIISINMTSVNTLTNNRDTGLPLDGHFSINNGTPFSTNLKNFEAAQMTDPTNVETFRPDYVLYKQQIGANQAFIFNTDTGGSSFLGGLDPETYANNGFSFVPEFAATQGSAMDMSAYSILPYLKYEDAKQQTGIDPETSDPIYTYFTLTGTTGTVAFDPAATQMTQGAYTGTYAMDAAKRMVSGDFASLYLKPSPAANGCYLGVTLGLAEIPDAWLTN